ncbi:formate/nitrite transporter family protein [Echinicola vietnamensis]|uniref:Formate/nitrite transporter family protein n=1 Tax=Echinicola vietnamensis (strain DSM 17526 / LMG 23754 / KMM 6221) TaxID=926556 RepID=L0G227_ECHVK|nr:formate/nitrite transporter family protein [Echinicola vietnamensis]AGA79572.1 formate/nitrite transporter family protein [Echinicola vietnamensis DSM 17526]
MADKQDKEEAKRQREEEKRQKSIDSELKKSKSVSNDGTKSHGEILKQQITEGLETYDKKASSLLLSSLTAGLEIGFSYLLICTVYAYFSKSLSEDISYKLTALVYPVGFIMVILGQSILFTEQTSLLTLPVLNKKRSVGSLLKIWGLVISGNLIGGFLIAMLLLWIGPRLGIFDMQIVGKVALHAVDFPSLVIFTSAVLAGWLMGLLSWLLSSSRDTLSKIVIIFIITSMMAFTGLHHSIVGNVEVFAGLIGSPEITFERYLNFQVFALLGNAVGGAVFVALLKYRAFVYNIDVK